jgi:hypothetical protein
VEALVDVVVVEEVVVVGEEVHEAVVDVERKERKTGSQ